MRWHKFHASQVMSSLSIYPGANNTGQKLVKFSFLAETWSEIDTNTEHCFSDKIFMQVIGLMEISNPVSAEHRHSAVHILCQPSERQTADSTHPAAVAPRHGSLSDNSCGELTWIRKNILLPAYPRWKQQKLTLQHQTPARSEQSYLERGEHTYR